MKKRTGANVIETVDGVRAAMATLQKSWPATVQVAFIQDQSKDIRQLLNDLQNSVVTAVLLVVVIILFVLGGRASIFVGIAIPASFLAGILGLAMAGMTLNIVALFSLILAVGMLVDDAIIVTEYAERRMSEGARPKEAYAMAATRMAGPVTAATLTRIAAFSPLLFWPGVVGQFMMYLPITLIATLSASLVTALIFTPTLGALIGKPQKHEHATAGRDGLYMRTVRLAVRHPLIVLILAGALLYGVIDTYGRYGKGVEFFPDIEPDTAVVLIHARGNISLAEKDAMVRAVEATMLDMPELETVYARSGEMDRGADGVTEDVVGQIQFTFVDWKKRRKAGEIMDEIRAKTAHLPGFKVEVTAQQAGPPTGKPIQVQLASYDGDALNAAAVKVADELAKRPEIRDLDNGLPMPGIDWRLEIDKAEAAKYGVGVARGRARRPAHHQRREDHRLPAVEHRQARRHHPPLPRGPAHPQRDRQPRIETSNGSVPIGNFIKRTPSRKVGIINRVDGIRVVTVTANLAENVNVAAVQQEVTAGAVQGRFRRRR